MHRRREGGEARENGRGGRIQIGVKRQMEEVAAWRMLDTGIQSHQMSSRRPAQLHPVIFGGLKRWPPGWQASKRQARQGSRQPPWRLDPGIQLRHCSTSTSRPPHTTRFSATTSKPHQLCSSPLLSSPLLSSPLTSPLTSSTNLTSSPTALSICSSHSSRLPLLPAPNSLFPFARFSLSLSRASLSLQSPSRLDVVLSFIEASCQYRP